MRPEIRLIAERRHREREELYMPKVAEAIETVKRDSGADISPLTPRQIALIIHFHRDRERRRLLMIKRIAKMMTPEQLRRSRLES
jgi:hypothetical protein